MSFDTFEEISTKERFDASTHADRLTRKESIQSERAVLVGVYLEGEGKTEKPLDELHGLAIAAGTFVVGELTQRRRKPEGATYIGSGKLEELKIMVESNDANVVIFDNDLGPAQTKNLEQELKVKVLDRTELILDIFASRAQSNEARLAVELAQLEYSLPRLRKMWTHLERQTVGGVGLRGPGEKQLEVDRRLAQKRILDLKEQLKNIHARRQREVAARKGTRTVCLVGYTNTGKSTLLNRLTEADVYVKDQLFATLDTRTRRWFLPGWGPVLLSDTVGFIRDLPTHLIASFRATLEEANQANLLLHVADSTNPELIQQVTAANNVLREIGIEEKDILLVLNKIDALESPEKLDIILERFPSAVPISAASGVGLEKLAAAVSDLLSKEFLDIRVELPIENGKIPAYLAKEGEILSREYEETRAIIHCRVPQYVIGQIEREPGVVIDRN
ncbi:MAG: GTPase HflX [Thermoguttaceae bacterium]